MKKKLKNQKKPKVIFTDFDGCLTDDRVWLNQEGEEFVAANRKDGLAVNRLSELGIKVVITSTETNKVAAINQYLNQNNLSWSESWYIGNDLNDLGAIHKAQFSICPKDGVKAVKREVDLKVKTKGGYGVLSELVTLIESSKI
jgi:3-deoxy-D-manno-octulosonate 8-phosphate phosphatase KdsC-like HAD superfamily phosphatase